MTLAAGTGVRVRDDWPETRGPCHIRTPYYLRGAGGTVVRHLGNFPNPEDLAFARQAPVLPLYHVRFDQPPIWGEGRPGDALLVEIFGHWLEPLAGSEARGADTAGSAARGADTAGSEARGAETTDTGGTNGRPEPPA